MDRQYELHVVFGSPSLVPWYWNIWLQVATELDPLVSSVDASPATYSRQFKRVGKRLQDVPFGRMAWSEKVHERWTHDSPRTRGISNEWEFCDTQLWIPGRAVCQRERVRPDVYFQMLNGGLGSSTQDLKFGSVVALGIANDLSEPTKSRARNCMSNIGDLLDARLRIFKSRPWSLPFGPYVKDSLNDLDTWLFRTGPRHTDEPTLALLHEDWQLVP
jgi:hypothetical protein